MRSQKTFAQNKKQQYKKRICITGDFLKFDSDNEEYGVFLINDENSYRLSYYTQNTAGTIIGRIESSIPAGTYTLVVKNKPTVTEETTKYKKQIVIS